MFKNTSNKQLFAAVTLAIVLAACGTIQGASSPRGVAAPGGYATDEGQIYDGVHLTEGDVAGTSRAPVIDPALAQAIALAEKNEQQRLAQQGANASRPSVSSPNGDSANGGPDLVP